MSRRKLALVARNTGKRAQEGVTANSQMRKPHEEVVDDSSEHRSKGLVRRGRARDNDGRVLNKGYGINFRGGDVERSKE